MNDLYETIDQSYGYYRRYLNDGGDPIILPRHVHVPELSKGKVHLSALLGCPLQNAYKRHRTPEAFPLPFDDWTKSLHIMGEGSIMAAPVQEALVWALSNGEHFTESVGAGDAPRDILIAQKINPHSGAMVERSVEDSGLMVRGRMDALIWKNGTAHIIEIKRREPWAGSKSAHRNLPEPKLSDCFQVMGYGLITGVQSMNILILNRGDIKGVHWFNLWTLHPVGNGFILENEDGTRWDSPFNTPEHLNFDAVKAEIERQHRYLKFVENDARLGIDFSPPISDPANDTVNGWYCGSKTKPATETKGGVFTRRCPHFCHTDTGDGEWPTIKDSDGRTVILFDDIA